MAMQRGRHAAPRAGGAVVLLVAITAVLLVGAGSAVAAHRHQIPADARILPGVTIGGVAVGNMTREEAVSAVSRVADRRLARPIVVHAGKRTWHLTLARLGLHAHVGASVDAAFSLARGYSWIAKVYHRLTHSSVHRAIPLAYSRHKGEILAFVRDAAREVRVAPVDASIDLVNDRVVMQHSHSGRGLEEKAARKLLRGALADSRPEVSLPMRRIQPAVTDQSLGKTITLDVSENKLVLYNGFDVEKTYSVATAKPGFVTPAGTWEVVDKVENPTWHNPCFGEPGCWAAGEPEEIPPGPGNPLGTRALYLDAPGIRIHGTPSDSSIGSYASHGCIRMHISESEELYPLVPIGTKVLIFDETPWGNGEGGTPG